MIVHLSSVIVPHAQVSTYLEYVQMSSIPIYENAAGLVSVSLLQRPFVAYVELLTLSIWESEYALSQFVEVQSTTDGAKTQHGIIHFEPHTYQLVVSRRGGSRCADDLQPE